MTQTSPKSVTSGDGAIRASGGAFSRREQANEEMYARQRDLQLIAQLRKKLEQKEKEYNEKYGKPTQNSL